MNRLIYLVDPGDGEKIQYDLNTLSTEINDGRVEMKYHADDMSWTDAVRGTVAATLHDHGNGIRISFDNNPKNVLQFDYSEIEQLRALLQYYEEDSGCRGQFRTKIQKLRPIEDE